MRPRLIVISMLSIAAALLLISFIVGPPPMPLWYIALTVLVLLYGVAGFFGPRVRYHLRLWYPQKVKWFERFEYYVLLALLIYQGVHLMLTLNGRL